MVPTLRAVVDPLLEYTEPINSRISRKADALSPVRQRRFACLREKHEFLGHAFMMALDPYQFWRPADIPQLPLRPSFNSRFLENSGILPADALDEVALRPLMHSLLRHFEAAIAEFDEVFGERA